MSKFRGKGLIGKKIGMTSIFNERGDQLPVTVVHCGPNVVLGMQTLENGEVNLRIGYGEKREKLVNKPEMGQFKKAGVAPLRFIREFRVTEKDVEGVETGNTFGAAVFPMGQFIDVTGTSKGKGFAGVMKRHNFAGVSASHGAHKNHRKPGSIGGASTPGRVFRGQKMAGRMGAERVTTQNLTIHAIDAEKNLLLIKGAVPGARGRVVLVRTAVKGA